MKIAMLTNNYKPFTGGVPVSVERQAKALRKAGHKVVIFAPDYGVEAKEEEDVVRCRIRRRKMINGMVYPRLINKEALERFAEEKFDCIHVHQPMFAGNTALYLGRKYNLPVIYTYHTRYEDYLHYIRIFKEEKEAGFLRRGLIYAVREYIVPAYMRWFTNRCDLVFAPTEGMRRRIVSRGTKTPVEVVPTGLGETFFRNAGKEAGKIRNEYLKGADYLLCTVSRLEEEKNLGFLLEGIREMKRRETKEGSFKALIIGEGSQKEELKERAQEYGLAGTVIFTGNIPNEKLGTYLQACDLFLFASKSETQGLVLQEAMASGCPCVAVNASGSEDAIEDGKNGFLTAEDVKEWSERAWDILKARTLADMKSYAKESVRAYEAGRAAKKAEGLYRIAVKEKIRKELDYEKERTAMSVFGIFKTS